MPPATANAPIGNFSVIRGGRGGTGSDSAPRLGSGSRLGVAVGVAEQQNKTNQHPPTPTPPMTSWLPPIPGLHRRDPEHRYWLGDVEFPISVTGVLACLKTAYAMERIEATRSSWEARGNTAHRALELFLSLFFSPAGWDAENAHELQQLKEGDYADWVVPLIGHDRWPHLQVIASEHPTCCTARRVAGTYDTAYIDEAGRTVLADLKSLGSAEASTYSTAAQLGGYMALEATHGVLYDAGQTIWCRPGSTTFSPLYSRAECLLAWAGAWATWRARHPDHNLI